MPYEMEQESGAAYRFEVRHVHIDADKTLGFTVRIDGKANLEELWALGPLSPVIPFFVISQDPVNMSTLDGIVTIDGNEGPFNLISGTTYNGKYIMYDRWINKLPI